MKKLLLIATISMATPLCANELTDEAIRANTPESTNMPTDREIEVRSIEQRPQIDRALNVQPRQAQIVPDAIASPNDLSSVNPSAPTPSAQKPFTNIMSLAEGLNKRPQQDPFSLMPTETQEGIVFVSFSMPRPMLKELLEQAALFNFKVAFRGVPSGKLDYNLLQREVIALGPKYAPVVELNPVLFTRYAVTTVPTFAIGKYGQNPGLDENGCLPKTKFVKISGEISIAYALNEFVRRGPQDLRALARSYQRL